MRRRVAGAILFLDKFSRCSCADMRGARAPSVSEEGGSWGKHGFTHEASAPEAREAK